VFQVIKVTIGRCIPDLSYLEEEIQDTFNGRVLRLFELVKKLGKINRYEAYSILNWTPGIYDRVHPAFVARHSLQIIYDKKTKNYIYSPTIQEKLI